MTTKDHKYLPYGRQYLDDEDIDAVVEVLRGDWLTTGPTVHKFETALRDVVRSTYVTSCSSGTAALHMAYMAVGLGQKGQKQKQRVIVPAISFIATANGAEYCGVDVLFTDVDPNSGMMRAQDVLSLIAGLSQDELDSVVAITPVNLTGEVAEIEAISQIAQKYNWKIIIDSCHALGSRYLSQAGVTHTVGDCQFAHMEVFSFHPVKTIAMGEGGAVTTNDKALYDKLCLLRNHGMERDPEKWQAESGGEIPPPWYYEMQLLGYNYRQSDIHSALGVSQLKKLPSFMDKRRRLVAKYDDLLAALSPHIKPIKSAPGRLAVRHLYVVLIDFEALGMTRINFVGALSTRKVGTQVHYIPINEQPYYTEKYGVIKRPGADLYYQKTLSLPLHVSMTEEDVEYVVEQISDIVQGLRGA